MNMESYNVAHKYSVLNLIGNTLMLKVHYQIIGTESVTNATKLV